jgi:hypothetical protein
MCNYDEVSDNQIWMYAIFELESMLRRYKEIDGTIPRTSLILSYPPFSRDELEEEINRGQVKES